jgi:D-alanyl-D-alanine carboxypeptidase/D-alanyl-D-alanine-endopeptidase (penicillin-binding protein 4)
VRRPVVLLLLFTLAVLALGAGWQARELDAELDDVGSGATTDAAPPVARTALLSARRVPRWLQAPTADALLAEAVAPLAAASPAESCLVVSQDGRRIYEQNADTPLVPASTNKIVTGTAALEVLGADTRFRTAVVAAAPTDGTSVVDAGVVDGIWVVGGGDPVLATADYQARFDEPQVFTDYGTLADALVAAGVREIRGDVVGDESRYDAVRTVPTWDPVFIRDHEAGPLSALSLNDGFASYPPTRSNMASVPADDPAANAASVLIDLLRARGVTVTGIARSGAAPADATEVAAIQSAPLAEVVGQMLAASDNTTAELLIKELGHATSGTGTTAGGVAAARAVLEADGVAVEGIVLNDGSGLDRGDRLTCSALVAMLEDAGADSLLAGGMAVAGQTGTLRERLVGTEADGNLRAKTGSVRNSRALAGFADTEAGAVTFAYIANASPTIDGATNLALQDQIGLALVGYPQGPSLEQLAPLVAQ